MVQGVGGFPENEITIQGPHRGDVTADVVRIARTGSVLGNVTARVVKCAGRLEGDVDAKEFYASATARVRGVIRHETIGLMPGCMFAATAERVPFAAFDAAAPAAEAEQAAPETPAVAAPAQPAAEVQAPPFRAGPSGIVWVPPSEAAAERGAREESPAPVPVLTDERRAKMMDGVMAALAAVEAGLSGVAAGRVQSATEAVPQSAAAPEPVAATSRTLPSLLG